VQRTSSNKYLRFLNRSPFLSSPPLLFIFPLHFLIPWYLFSLLLSSLGFLTSLQSSLLLVQCLPLRCSPWISTIRLPSSSPLSIRPSTIWTAALTTSSTLLLHPLLVYQSVVSFYLLFISSFLTTLISPPFRIFHGLHIVFERHERVHLFIIVCFQPSIASPILLSCRWYPRFATLAHLQHQRWWALFR
jgi:hypothetical protein